MTRKKKKRGAKSTRPGRKRLWLWLGVALALLVLVAGSLFLYKVVFSPPVNVLLITMDTTRADALSCYRGGPMVISPMLDRLAEQSFLFEYCLTSTPMTLPGHASILTGLYPRSHGARYNGYFSLDEGIETWAEVMKKQGYRTAAFISAFVLDSIFNLDQGFERYSDKYTLSRSDAMAIVRQANSERRAEETTADVLGWLGKHGREPFFIWVHYFDPHYKYDPPVPYDRMFTGARSGSYLGEIAYTDNCIDQLLGGLKEMGVYERTLVVVTSDHGEGLGDHGEMTHSFFLYDSTLHVPLIIHLPGQRRGRRVGGQVRVIDIMPTVLDYLGVDAPGPLDGSSLLPVLKGDVEKMTLENNAEALAGYFEYNWPALYSLSDGRYKYILHGAPELYDRFYDKRELRNVNAEADAKARRLRGKLLSYLRRPSAAQRATQPDAQAVDKLRSLGYLMSTGPREVAEVKEEDFNVDYTGKKDMIQIVIEARARLMVAERQEEVARQLGRLEEVRQQYGESAIVLQALADGYTRMKYSEKAEETYRRLVEFCGRDPNQLMRLASFLAQERRYREAVEILQEARRKSEEISRHDPDVYFHLARAYLVLKEVEQAREYYRQGLRLDPDNHIGNALKRRFAKVAKGEGGSKK